MTPDDFLTWIWQPAVKICKEYNLPHQVCIAQAALESGWGKYTIGEYNIFGRKWNGTGDYKEVLTTEYYDGVETTITDKFQLYTSLYDAIDDWCQLMEWGPYKPASDQYKQDGDVIAFVHGIAGTYATDPAYADKVITTMKACDLI